MKRLVVSLLFLFSVSGVFAQFSQGRMLIGGALGVEFSKTLNKDNNSSSEISRTTGFAFEPTFGYFIVNRFAIGAGLSFTNSKTKTPNGNSTTDEETTFNPLFRYYLPTKVFFQLKVPLGGSQTTYETSSGISKRSYNVSGLAFGVGYAVMLNPHVALEPLIQFSTKRYNQKNDADRLVENSFNFRLGFQIYLGR